MFHHAQHLVSLVHEDSSTRVQKATATVSPSQLTEALQAFAAALSELVPPDALRELACHLHGSVGVAIADACSERRGPAALVDASLVMSVARSLPRGFPMHACALVRLVLAEIEHQVGPDSTRAFVAEMPAPLRKLWPAPYWKVADVARAA